MIRAIVLLVCLTAAGTIVGFTHYASQPHVEEAAVFVVPQRSPPPANLPTPSKAAVEVPADKTALARAIQRELKRVGCYSGDISGVWTTSSRMAMKSFVDRANAALPIDNPDAVLLSLVRSHQGLACTTECPPGQAAGSGGACLPPAMPVKAINEPAAADTKPDGGNERAAAIVLPATAAAGLATAATVSKPANEKHSRIEARAPAPSPDLATSEKLGLSTSNTKPLAKMQERRARKREKTAQPPKFIRDFLKTVDRTFRPR